MTQVFADTSFFIALLNPRDDDHQSAIALMAASRHVLVTSAWVLTELANHQAKRRDRPLVLKLFQHLRRSKRCLIIPARERDFEAGWALYANRSDKDWSLTDCISFQLMTRRRITAALSADHHFTQAGFRALLVELR